MAVFRYRMQSILDVKTKLEEQAKDNFALTQRKLVEEEYKLSLLFSRKEAYEEEGAHLRINKLHTIDIMSNRDAIAHIDDMIVEQHKVIEAAKKETENARKLMLEARKETKTQEKLREHAFDAFIKDENKKEITVNDELTNYRFQHGENGE